MSDRVTSTRPWIDIGNDQPVMLNDLIREMVVCEAEGGLAHAEITLDNAANHDGHGLDFAFEFSDTDAIRLGSELRLLFPARDTESDEDQPREVFAGRVSALEFIGTDSGHPRLVVMAEDLLMPFRMRRRTRALEGKPLRDLLGDLATDAQLTGADVDSLNDEIMQRHQVDESDLSFLRKLLADWDADVQTHEGKLTIGPRAAINRGTVPLSYGTTLQDVRISADLAHQRARFSLSAYDQVQGTAVLASMDTTELGPGEGRKGAEYLDPFGDTLCHLSGAPVANQAEAQAMIDARGAQAARRFVTARGTARGNPLIRVGAHLEIDGVGPRFSNTYYTTKARHVFSRQSGYVTEFEAQCAYFKGEVAA